MATSNNPRIYASFTLLCLGVWLLSADTLVTATIAPSLVEDLGGIAYINWTISLYEVGAILAGAAAGAIGTRVGIKQVFIGATLVYGAGCVLAAVSFNMALLIGGRFIQDVGRDHRFLGLWSVDSEDRIRHETGRDGLYFGGRGIGLEPRDAGGRIGPRVGRASAHSRRNERGGGGLGGIRARGTGGITRRHGRVWPVAGGGIRRVLAGDRPTYRALR